MSRRTPQILFIDAYDSYSYNIIVLVKQRTGAEVTVIHHDDAALLAFSDKQWDKYLDHFDAAIAGPGPGNPTNTKDVGLIARLWHVTVGWQIPVLGICLGHQSLGVAFGAVVHRLATPKHGTRTTLLSTQPEFLGNRRAMVVEYNSLYIDLGHRPMEGVQFWQPSDQCPDIQPLAWRLDGLDHIPVVLAIKHTSWPFWGVQYHPESICTDVAGASIIDSWWAMAVEFKAGECRRDSAPPTFRSLGTPPSMCRTVSTRLLPQETPSNQPSAHQDRTPPCAPSDARKQVHWLKLPLADNNVKSILDALPTTKQIILLESGTKSNGEPVRLETGRFSIIGLPISHHTDYQLSYSHAAKLVTRLRLKRAPQSWPGDENTMFESLDRIMRVSQRHGGCPDIPFWGGFMGYISYEGSLLGLGVSPSSADPLKPEICFAFVQRSIVVDHVEKVIYVQSIAEGDTLWVQTTASELRERSRSPSKPDNANIENVDGHIVSQESSSAYQAKVKHAQEHIAAGSSYELCLTAQTQLSLPSHQADPRTLYSTLRTTNPAPFAAHLSLDLSQNQHLTIMSSSPERFVSVSRTGQCQFRPIKGTVRKTSDMTRKRAEEILWSSKEQAENLMIVDLIRHDLHGVTGAGNVQVSKLMGIEEYETVFQLVSVIEGHLHPVVHGPCGNDMTPIPPTTNGTTLPTRSKTPIDLLQASLPPGSMTGAPKKRSCELLKSLEDHKPRGIYSGVLGYLDVGGGADFSVVIRTAVSWSSDDSIKDDGSKEEKWSIGAGGAVTAQSIPVEEWKEMRGKREAVLGVFLGKNGANQAKDHLCADCTEGVATVVEATDWSDKHGNEKAVKV